MPVRLGLYTCSPARPNPLGLHRVTVREIDPIVRAVRYTPSLSGGCLLITVRVKHARSTSLANGRALVSRPGSALAHVALGGRRSQCGRPSCLNLLRRCGCRVWRDAGLVPAPGCAGEASAGARRRDIIARWRVEAEDWQRFLALNRQWPSGANGRLNEFIPSEAAEPNGVEVIVGKAAVQIGESIHRVSLRSTPEIRKRSCTMGRRR